MTMKIRQLKTYGYSKAVLKGKFIASRNKKKGGGVKMAEE